MPKLVFFQTFKFQISLGTSFLLQHTLSKLVFHFQKIQLLIFWKIQGFTKAPKLFYLMNDLSDNERLMGTLPFLNELFIICTLHGRQQDKSVDFHHKSPSYGIKARCLLTTLTATLTTEIIINKTSWNTKPTNEDLNGYVQYCTLTRACSGLFWCNAASRSYWWHFSVATLLFGFFCVGAFVIGLSQISSFFYRTGIQ